MKNIQDFLVLNKIEFSTGISLDKISKIAGSKITITFCSPRTVEQLRSLITFCLSETLSFDVVGGLSNTYFSSTYSNSILISTVKVNTHEIQNGKIICSTGCNLTKIARILVAKGFGQFTGFIGIPGTVGAAAINNTGALSSVMSNVVSSVTILTKSSEIIELSNSEMQYAVRTSMLKTKMIEGYVLYVELDISVKSGENAINQKLLEEKEFRQEYIDGGKYTLGSIFVSSTLPALLNRYKLNLFLKKIIYAPVKLFAKDMETRKRISKNLAFFFLGAPELSEHCESLNRFSWDKNPSQEIFYQYIEKMQKMANQKLTIEIDIK